MFQKSVIKKYLAGIDQDQIKTAYKAFKDNYTSSKIERIKRMKEEEYQGGFLRDVFVSALGYTLKPEDDFNLVREFKNQTDGKKADGAILKDGKAIAVIELKSTKTKDFKNATKQAFGYKIDQPVCKYVITSNFHKLRFFIDNKVEFEEFDLFDLSKQAFEVLYLVLSKDSIFAGTPKKLKEDSIYQEENISKQFYKDYSSFKNKLFENLIKNNPGYNKLTLFKKSQKLIDRFLFILFSEDRELLQPNFINIIIQRYKTLEEHDSKKPLYNIFKQFFGYLNTGYKGNESTDSIPAYNGGLFCLDETLDKIIIDDETLLTGLPKLSSYDFNTELDVDILGHIFEHSLSEIEEITAELEGVPVNKAKSKRKKDGVFYTPKYITQYIVENTIGRLCTEKKEESELNDIEIDDTCHLKSGKLSEKGKKLYSKIENYKSWLSSLKIVDPACGSGAFLNQALNFLIDEHQFIIDLETELKKGQIALFNIEAAVLENNLYGVDINEESVEIAKLSLWLRTARKGRTLTDLSNNIKCGNSLIDDPEVASERAFKWEEEFPKIMGDGGFDVVIGNPPYFNIQTLGAKSSVTKSIQNNYQEIWRDKSDIIFYFIAKAIQITRNKVCFIVSNAFLFSKKADKLRNYILENAPIQKIINFEKYMVFDDASITTAIIELDKNKIYNNCLAYSFKDKNYSKDYVSQIIYKNANFFEVKLRKDKVFALIDKKIDSINKKIDNNYLKLKQVVKIGKGMETAANKVFLFKNFPSEIPKKFIKKRMSGEIIKKYEIDTVKEYILYFEDVELFEKLPYSIQNHLSKNKEALKNRATVKNEGRIWWRYSRPMHRKLYHLDKIWCSYRAKENIFCFDNTREYIGLTNTTVIFDTNENINLKYLLALLNSKVLNFRYKTLGKQTGNGVFEYFENGVGRLPIPEILQEKQKPFLKNVDRTIELKQKINNYKILYHQSKRNNDFDREICLKKKIEDMEIIVIDLNNEIDQMVYKLYDLTDEEIEIVESGT